MANEILTPTQMYEADRLAVAEFGQMSKGLMEKAGRAVAAAILERYQKRRVAVLCGPGNNGGDGFVVARIMKSKGWPVKLYLAGERNALGALASAMAGKWTGAINAFSDFEKTSGNKAGPQLIVDGLFGAGLNRDMPGQYVDAIHGAGVPVVSIDVPSGLDGLTGQVRGTSVTADLTVTFFRKKPAHVLQPGRRLCGQIIVADIGIPDAVVDTLGVRIYENAEPHLPSLAVDTHKFHRGHALVWSGPELNTGAARLAALGAARVGAGLTSIAGPRTALLVQALHVTSIMLKVADTQDDLDLHLRDGRFTALCIGPAGGVNEDLRRRVLLMLNSGIATVLDADALTAFAQEPETLFMAIRARPERDCIITPHEGEFKRLFNSLNADPESKIERAREASARSGAILVLKGPDTVIANPDGNLCVNTNAPAKLATAGSGDVLAGLITGLLAQGMDGFAAACAGVWLHGDAANRIARRTIIAEDLIDMLGVEVDESNRR